MQAGTFAPPPGWADRVEALWWGAWDLRGEPDHVTELLGDPCVNVVVEGGDGGASARIVGVWSTLWARRLSGRGWVRGVKLRPGAVRAVWPGEAAELTDRHVPLAGVVASADAVVREVGALSLEAGLRRLVEVVDVPRSTEMREVVSLVAHVRGSTVRRVEELAAHSGRSVRWLQRRFRRHVGLSPKAVIRRHRLQEAALQVERGDAPNLADLAYDLGYADQAHLARDFRAVTGLTLRGFEARLDAPAVSAPNPTTSRRSPPGRGSA